MIDIWRVNTLGRGESFFFVRGENDVDIEKAQR